MRKVIFALIIVIAAVAVVGCNDNKEGNDIVYMWNIDDEEELGRAGKMEKIEGLDDYEYIYGECYSDYQYSKLEENEKRFYKYIIYMAENGYNAIYIYNKNALTEVMTQFEEAYFAVALDCPFVASSLGIKDVQSGNEYRAYIKNIMYKDEIARAYSFGQHVINEVKGKTENSTDKEELVKKIYMSIIDETIYDDAQNDVLSTLETKTANCDGISKTFEMIFNMVGVKTGVVTSETNSETGEGHAWNIVEFNGKYYYIDGTFGVSLRRDIKDFSNNAYMVSYKIPEEVMMSNKEYSIYCKVTEKIENDYSGFEGVIEEDADINKVLDINEYEYASFYIDINRENAYKVVTKLYNRLRENGYRYNAKLYDNQVLVICIWKS